MEVEELIQNYPRLYHMAEDGSWEGIRKHGLLSAAALTELFEVPEQERRQLLAAHRPESVAISHPVHGRAIIRDQKPMDDAGLLRALRGTGITPSQWYANLNGRVYFWLRPERLETLLNARAYRGKPQIILEIESAPLVRQYARQIELSPLNSGCTKPMAFPRGHDTFLPISDFPFQKRRKTRGLNQAIVELTIPHAVPDIARFITRVQRRQGSKVLEMMCP